MNRHVSMLASHTRGRLRHRPLRTVLCLCGALVLTACGDAPQASNAVRLAQAARDVGPVPAAGGTFVMCLQWVNGAPSAGDVATARLVFSLPPSATGDISVVDVEQALLSMPAHTHPPRAVQIERVIGIPHAVQLSGMDLRMSGAWQLLVAARVNDRADQASIMFSVP